MGDLSRKRKVKTILMNIVRGVLLLAFILSIYQGRQLIMVISIAAMLLTFVPGALNRFFRIELNGSFDILIILFLYGILFFLEVRGAYSNLWITGFIMNLATAIALGLVGLTVVYTISKNESFQASPLIIAFFSFCVTIALGTIWELSETLFDYLFDFHLHEAGFLGTMGDLAAYPFGALIVSAIGYFYIKQGKSVLISSYLENLIERNRKSLGLKKENDHVTKVREIIKNGEGKNIEFKSTIRTNLHTKKIDKNIEHAALKTINAYLNSDGGTLLIGASDKGELLGLENDQFPTHDHMHRHLMQLINDNLGAEFLPYIESHVVEIEGKKVLKVECKKSTKEVFLKNGNEEQFYVRQGSLSQPLHGSSLVEYIENVFRK